MKKFVLILLILFIASCKLFEAKDTIDPIVNLTIQGGNEISRGVTLYLDIEDDSRIESVSIMIDDTTAYTVETNFDTIRFDVTPFADEIEHILYAVVEDSEGNIGESKKLDVVITEFPGWRIYDKKVHRDLTIDDNGRIWTYAYGQNGIIIFDPTSKEIREISNSNSELPQDWINDIQVVEGSRVWIATDDYICEYHYDLDKWIKIIKVSDVEIPWGHISPISLLIDNNYDLYIGSYYCYYLMKYNGANFLHYEISNVHHQWDLVMHPNGSIFIAGEYGVDVLKNGIISSFNDYPRMEIERAIIDSNGVVYTVGWNRGELLNYANDSWVTLNVEFDDYIHPLFVSSDNIIYFCLGNESNIVTLKESTFTNWSQYDTPFNNELYNFWGGGSYQAIAEDLNGDIWMIVNGERLMRYRVLWEGIRKL